jgi:hypothetical protein
LAEEEITIDTASYEREHGHKPRGRDIGGSCFAPAA